ncbi:chromosome partitioning protein [Oxalobacteraceae bacterium GrIS 2.11]
MSNILTPVKDDLQKLTISDLTLIAERASDVLAQVHTIMARPNPMKSAPVFTSAYIADLIKVDKKQIRYLAEKHNLPTGKKIPGSKFHEYTLREVMDWGAELGKFPKRPADKLGKAIATVNYKGGVAKTSTTVALAQGLALRNQKVLIIDCDGQGTATQLLGINPEQNVTNEQTIMPCIYGEQPDLRYAVQQSYWENLSIIPASSGILAAEFALPGRAMKTRGFEFWNVLNKGINSLREEFDVILFDTSPSLSHLTINSMLAADALLMPCPPDALDFASSAQFWGLFAELAESLPGVAENKTYDFMTVVYTKVQSNDAARLVKTWMEKAYGSHINGIEIPESTAAKMATAQLKTIYDLARPDGSLDAYKRYKDPVDRLADYVLDKVAVTWRSK